MNRTNEFNVTKLQITLCRISFTNHDPLKSDGDTSVQSRTHTTIQSAPVCPYDARVEVKI